MLKLDPGNVLLKPSHRRQLMSWLKRAMRLGHRMANPAISIIMHRIGRSDLGRGSGLNWIGRLVYTGSSLPWSRSISCVPAPKTEE